ncbi:hypothetical protein LTR78_008083 [Recurvomyces mirabilis]|uniref:AMP-binding enzyme C-terminal domain-containing protein n=1 Tax=Recurvomyces mirabilis TaxID=574656 RepID=A0AAE0TQW1_9PEZI|nr:hypothetical protein LTR78_008083 [Recurvomyces mirabilis]KAK5150810.1 hypothetical protein LTS14_009874 [Recurvomyces mirabilis]
MPLGTRLDLRKFDLWYSSRDTTKAREELRNHLLVDLLPKWLEQQSFPFEHARSHQLGTEKIVTLASTMPRNFSSSPIRQSKTSFTYPQARSSSLGSFRLAMSASFAFAIPIRRMKPRDGPPSGTRPRLVKGARRPTSPTAASPRFLDRDPRYKADLGKAVPGVEARISAEGELLIKSPFMFSKYLYNPAATLAAHDSEGYFKTDDTCRKEGDFFFIVGRASLDIIKSGGYKIGTLEIERCLLEIPYLQEAMVIGVEDEEFEQRVGAVVTLSNDLTGLRIDDLRAELRKKLPGYQLPTILRVVPGELPRGATGKVQKKILGPQYFAPGQWRANSEVQVWGGQKKPGVEARARL